MKTTKKGSSLKKVGNIHAGFGHVASIRMGEEYPSSSQPDDDGMAEIAVHHGPKPKPPKPMKGGGFAPEPYKSRKTSRVHIPHEEAKELKIGDRVRVTLHRHSS